MQIKKLFATEKLFDENKKIICYRKINLCNYKLITAKKKIFYRIKNYLTQLNIYFMIDK